MHSCVLNVQDANAEKPSSYPGEISDMGALSQDIKLGAKLPWEARGFAATAIGTEWAHGRGLCLREDPFRRLAAGAYFATCCRRYASYFECKRHYFRNSCPRVCGPPRIDAPPKPTALDRGTRYIMESTS